VFQVRRYEQGAYLARQGHLGTEAFLILDGLVGVRVEGEGYASALAEVQVGEIVGEMAMLELQPRAASLLALQPTTVLVLEREAFLCQISVQPEIAIHLLRLLSGRLRATISRYAAKVSELHAVNAGLESCIETRTRELADANRALTELVSTDFLTQASSRQSLSHKLSLLCQSNTPFVVLMLDIDHFKLFNDAHGHPAGDKLLKDFCEVLRAQLRERDILGRYGGEEFLILLPGQRRAEGAVVAERLRGAIAGYPFENAATQPLGHISISAGLAVFPDEGKDSKGLVDLVDQRLYTAKREGRNRCCCG
jgi:diguanylate cyclase (GGDEF)-like protein